MKMILSLMVIAFGIAGAAEPIFRRGSSGSPYGESPRDVKEIIARQKPGEHEVLRELTNRPLEETFEFLSHAVGDTYYPDKQRIAREILYNHPDFENFMQRTLRKMTTAFVKEGRRPLKSDGTLDFDEAMKLPPPHLNSEDALDVEVSKQTWQRMRGVIQLLPSAELRIRLTGPCLNGVEYVFHASDYTEYGPANDAADIFRMAVKQATGEVLPTSEWGADVKAAREWWAKNEAKYAWKPPEPRPASQPTPIPQRVPLNQTGNSKQPPHENAASPTSTTPTESEGNTSNTLWFIGVALLLAAIGVWLRARKR